MAGAFIALEFTLNIFGVVVAYWLEFGLGFVGDGRSQIRWRFPIAFQIIPLVCFLVCGSRTIFLPLHLKMDTQIALHWMPESPRWLIKVGRVDEAKEILQRLRSDDSPSAPADESGANGNEKANAEFDQIVDVVQLEMKHSKMNSYWNMFWGIGKFSTQFFSISTLTTISGNVGSGDLHIARRVQLSIWLQIIQEWVGIAAITVYAPTIFAGAGYGARKSQWLSGLNDVCSTRLIYTVQMINISYRLLTCSPPCLRW